MSGSSQDLYAILGVGRDASEEDLKKAYKRAALLAHPDKPTGSKEKFQAVNEAYTVLSNAEARAEYDHTGRVPREGEAPPPPSDLMEMLGSLFQGGFGVPGGIPIPMMFGGGSPMSVMRRARGPNKVHEIGVPLADLWAGKTFTLHMKRDVLCGGCAGKGGTGFRPCGPCGGRCFRVVRQQMGPMIIASQEPCQDCHGAGEKASATCVECGGRRVTETEKTLEVRIERGMTEGDRIVFPEACSESPDFERPGDVVLVLRAASADAGSGWERRGDALVVEVSLTLAESLLGWERVLEGHPSGTSLPVTWEGGVVRDREVLRVPGWGMPIRRIGDGIDVDASPDNKVEFGDLLLVCRIQEEQQGAWSEQQRRALQSVWADWKAPTGGAGAHRVERYVTSE
jgi:DnaJ family protein A protein 2